MSDWSGGCLCGKVRFRLLSEPFDTGWCHCRTCQLNSGSPAMVFATVPFGDYQFEAGEEAVRTVASSRFGYRTFCAECGTPLYLDYDRDHYLRLTVGSLDDPERVKPGGHYGIESRLSWVDCWADLPGEETQERF